MDRQKKIEILSRLVKDGHVTFEEGVALLETEKEYVYVPQTYWSLNNQPLQPFRDLLDPFKTYCGTTVNSVQGHPTSLN